MDQHTCPPDHAHANTTVCYGKHRCRCFACRLDNAQRTTAYATRTGLPYSLPLEPIAAHIAHLKAFGYTYKAMALAAGINEGTPYRVANGRLKFVQGRLGRALLAVKPNIDDLDLGTIIPSRGLQRRIQALGAIGWTVATIAPHVGISRAQLVRSYNITHVTVRTHLRVAHAYEQLWNTQPPVTDEWSASIIKRTLTKAKRLGWAPPLAWDDIDNDADLPQPDATDDVDVIAIELAVTEGTRVRLTTAERREAVRQLHAHHHTDRQIAEMLRVSIKTIERDRDALELPAAVDAGRQPIFRKQAA